MAILESKFRKLRCSHCAGPLSKEMEISSWTVPPLIRDSFTVIGSAVGDMTSAFYSFNHGTCERTYMAAVFLLVWWNFVVIYLLDGHLSPQIAVRWPVPPVIVFSSTCAGLAGGSVPALTQLSSSSYHAAADSSS